MSLFRKWILSSAGNRVATALVSKHGMRFASRFVAGTTLEDAIDVVRNVNSTGMDVTLDHLGESVSQRSTALKATKETLQMLDAIDISGVSSNVSVKLTQLGLDIDPAFCFGNIDQVVHRAKEKQNFVRIDMEDSPRIPVTIDLLNALVERHGTHHVGLVIQSYLYRSEQDVMELGKMGVNLRIVKGAYKEPKEIAYPNKKDVDSQYIRLIQTHLKNGCYTAIATHDEKIILLLKSWIQKNHIPPHLYEFQMLYGVRPLLQQQLVQEGYKVRIYIPYGEDWYAYFTRRIAERPANALFILKNLAKR